MRQKKAATEKETPVVTRKKRQSLENKGGDVTLHKKRLADYIFKTCKEKKLSLRSLSVKANLSPGTVHSIIHRDYEPSLYSLNQLADFLGVKRQYMWYMAGLLEEEDMEKELLGSDPRMHYYCEKVARLPEKTRELVLGIVADLVNYHSTPSQGRSSTRNK